MVNIISLTRSRKNKTLLLVKAQSEYTQQVFISIFSIALLDFPSCVIGEQPELTAETLEIGDTSTFCWRNMFSCINLLRVLNKLTKWKHSRIMVSNFFYVKQLLITFAIQYGPNHLSHCRKISVKNQTELLYLAFLRNICFKGSALVI